ncbi:MAG: hypothetical protein KBS56_03795 [Clostridiales bacterium]|nr:hypothetical protein [Candidatus Crickella equi]
MSRKHELENFIVNCCKSSSIYFNGEFQAVKYLCGQGKVVFIEQSRMLDYVEVLIPDYDAGIDEPLLMELLSDGIRIKGCESHEYQGCHYTYTFTLR